LALALRDAPDRSFTPPRFRPSCRRPGGFSRGTVHGMQAEIEAGRTGGLIASQRYIVQARTRSKPLEDGLEANPEFGFRGISRRTALRRSLIPALPVTSRAMPVSHRHAGGWLSTGDVTLQARDTRPLTLHRACAYQWMMEVTAKPAPLIKIRLRAPSLDRGWRAPFCGQRRIGVRCARPGCQMMRYSIPQAHP